LIPSGRGKGLQSPPLQSPPLSIDKNHWAAILWRCAPGRSADGCGQRKTILQFQVPARGAYIYRDPAEAGLGEVRSLFGDFILSRKAGHGKHVASA